MSTGSWIERAKKSRELKKAAKLRKKFEFLMKELNESQERIINQVIREQAAIVSSESEKLKNGFANAIDSLKTQMIEKSNYIGEQVAAFSEQQQANMSETKLLLQKILKQLEEIQDENRNLYVKNQGLLEDNAKNMEEKSKGILLSIEEVQSLMKIVAVNNLLDEI